MISKDYLDVVDYFNNHSILFSFCGNIDRSFLNELLKIIKNRLTAFEENIKTVNRVYNALNECIENIIIHSPYQSLYENENKTLVLLSKYDEHYHLITGNHVNEMQQDELMKHLDGFVNLEKEKQKSLYKEQLSNKTYSDNETAGLGFIDLVLKSDSFKYGFKKFENKILFTIDLTIKRD